MGFENVPDNFFTRLIDMLEKHMGGNTEIVLHDLTKSYEHTIVDIRNGEITGRNIGGSGTNLGLEILKGTGDRKNQYNYITKLKDGRYLRSSTMYFTNDKDEIVGSLCLNTDITESLKLEKRIKEYNGLDGNPELQEIEEVFTSDINQLLDFFISKAQSLVDKKPEEMTKEDRLKFLEFLDNKGAFLITKSGERVQDYLGISKYTLYTYLEIIRSEKKEK